MNHDQSERLIKAIEDLNRTLQHAHYPIYQVPYYPIAPINHPQFPTWNGVGIQQYVNGTTGNNTNGQKTD